MSGISSFFYYLIILLKYYYSDYKLLFLYEFDDFYDYELS